MTLHKAAEEGDLDIVRYWTEKDPASFNKTINYGLLPHIRAATPLHISAERGHLDVVKFFFESGVDGTLQSMAAKVFITSCQQNKLTVVKECLGLGADVNMVTNDGRWSGKYL